MQALEIQGIKMQALLIAMHLFFRFVEFSMLYFSKTIVIILLPYLCVKYPVSVERKKLSSPRPLHVIALKITSVEHTERRCM